jgi:hypothetical protein
VPRTASKWHGIVRILSAELQQDDIPGRDADWWPTINEFALSFDGYERFGSFDACAEMANKCAERYHADGLLPAELDTLRACLFFEQRRWRHFEANPDEGTMAYLHTVLAHMREIVGRRDASLIAENEPVDTGGTE